MWPAGSSPEYYKDGQVFVEDRSTEETFVHVGGIKNISIEGNVLSIEFWWFLRSYGNHKWLFQYHQSYFPATIKWVRELDQNPQNGRMRILVHALATNGHTILLTIYPKSRPVVDAKKAAGMFQILELFLET